MHEETAIGAGRTDRRLPRLACDSTAEKSRPGAEGPGGSSFEPDRGFQPAREL